MNIEQLLQIGIVGVAISSLLGYFKANDSPGSKLWVVGASIVVGAFYVIFQDAGWWNKFTDVLTAASTVYTASLVYTNFLNK